MKPSKLRSRLNSRRQFVRKFALGTATTVVGTPWIGTLLVSLLGEGRAAAANEGMLRLRLTDFPPLLEGLGSVRVSVNPMGGSYPSGDFYPVIISRGSGNTFYALSSACTHRGCVVAPFDGSIILCPCHGSEFAIDGTVTKPPADANLKAYPVDFDGVNTLNIAVPGLGYSITRYSLENGASPRVRLEFPTFAQVDYEVRFRPTSTAPWSVVSFATTLNGPADNKVLTGDGLPATAFVDRTSPAGFYCVAIIVRKV
jgi:nitrite reductase/ring-hydroxylating ferredoxin subunit